MTEEEVLRQLEIDVSKMMPNHYSKAELEAKDKAEKRRKAAWSNLKKHPGIMSISDDLENRWLRQFCIDDVLTSLCLLYWRQYPTPNEDN